MLQTVMSEQKQMAGIGIKAIPYIWTLSLELYHQVFMNLLCSVTPWVVFVFTVC